jgi:hypothetical protein
MSALNTQVGGDHYKTLKIQPVEYIHANGLPFVEGCIVKYATRWRDKGGIKDLEKIIHFAQLLIELEGKQPATPAKTGRDLYDEYTRNRANATQWCERPDYAQAVWNAEAATAYSPNII